MTISELKAVAREYKQAGLDGYVWSRWRHLLDLIEMIPAPDSTADEMREWVRDYLSRNSSQFLQGWNAGYQAFAKDFLARFDSSYSGFKPDPWTCYLRFAKEMSHGKARHD